MTTKRRAASSQTTTAGSRSSKADQILELALVTMPTTWFAALPQDEKELLEEIRDRWHANRNVTGVSAASLAKAILTQLPDLRLPKQKGLAEWLIRSGGEPRKS